MKLYIFTVVKCEVINIKFLSKDLHRVHCDINPPLKNKTLSFLPSLPPPPLKFANCSNILFRHPPPLYWFFVNLSPVKFGFFSETPRY